MRAFATKSLLIAILVSVPGTADAQLSQLFGISGKRSTQRATSKDAVVVAGFEQPVAMEQVEPVQFAEVIPPALTEAAPMMASPGNGATPDQLSDAVSQSLAPQNADPSPDAYSSFDGDMNAAPAPTFADAPAEYPATDTFTQPASTEMILDGGTGMGQPYDIPVSDVIAEEAAEVYSTNNWFRGGTWYSEQEVVMLLRADLPNVHIAVEPEFVGNDAGGFTPINNPATTNSLSSKEFDFTFEAGTRLSLGKILGRDVANRDHGIEFKYFGLFEYTGQASITSVAPTDQTDPTVQVLPGFGIRSLLGSVEANSTLSGVGFVFVNDLPGFSNSDRQDVTYEADLNSFEFNYTIGARPARDRLVMQPDGRWVRHATPSKIRGMYAGLRYIRQNEILNYTADGRRNLESVVNGANVTDVLTGPVARTGDYRVTTDNDLFGVQLGGEMIQKRTDWVFGLDGKVGGLINFADRHSLLVQSVDNDDTAVENLITRTDVQSLDDETLTFLGEANIYVAYYLRPNTSMRLGYNVLYMNGLATATNNMGLVGGFSKFELTGDSLYHGLNFGFNVSW